MTYPSALSDVGTPSSDDASLETACANALVAALPGAALMAQRHGGAPVPPAELAGGVSATYVGSRSADFAVILLDRTELAAAAGGDAARLRLGDVLRPALEQAASVIGGGMLGDAGDGAPASLFQSPDTVVFDLVGENGVAGWFAVQLRGGGTPTRRTGDVSAKLGRISNVEMTLAVEIGRARVSVRELLDAQPGTVIELDRSVGSQADVFLNGRMIAHGEVVVVDRRFAVRITEVLDTIDEG
ncbi:flagellar motor switch protein FliN [Amnibacterium sp.]|uniref:flagellar motor switch protein FliN n=1 Tax=Amnibacterium sp. TaxID=1872496 RepID=UPI0026237F8B|nr:flagellar motor switch protein FliN [Amnibacterium sp.]MCU1473626.1 flagellar motor switch protein FliN [Amnibacterium sp.]